MGVATAAVLLIQKSHFPRLDAAVRFEATEVHAGRNGSSVEVLSPPDDLVATSPGDFVTQKLCHHPAGGIVHAQAHLHLPRRIERDGRPAIEGIGAGPQQDRRRRDILLFSHRT